VIVKKLSFQLQDYKPCTLLDHITSLRRNMVGWRLELHVRNNVNMVFNDGIEFKPSSIICYIPI